MKNDYPAITLLGNNSGRNLGDATILSSILQSFHELNPQTRFYVPSIIPSFINKNYGKAFNAKGVNVLPWTGSIRLLGIPTMWCMAKSDLAFICDGIIFGRKLFSPHNFLISLVFLTFWSKLVGCKMIGFSCGIGPFPSKLSKILARYVMNNCHMLIMRDHDSEQLAREIGVTNDIIVTGDAAFLNEVSSKEAANKVFQDNNIDSTKPILGLNITPYFDSWLTNKERIENKKSFVEQYIEAVKIAEQNIDEDLQKIVFCCSPMDLKLTQELAEKIGAAVIDNSRYLSHEIQATMRECGLLVGMRVHSLILAAAVKTPVVGLVYARKVRGFLHLLESPEFSIELKDVSSELLAEKVVLAWNQRQMLRNRQNAVVDSLRSGAEIAVRTVHEQYLKAA